MPRNTAFPDIDAVQEPATDNLAAAWDKFGPELSRLIRALGINPAGADDILQEVYLSAREKCPKTLIFGDCPDFRGYENGIVPLGCPNFEDLRKWLIRVTVNRCRLEHRRTGRWKRMFLALTHLFDRRVEVAAGAESLLRDEQRVQVRRSLQSLDADARTVLVLRYFADMDSGEIGLILNLPESTVRGRLRKARQKLADRLRKAGYS
jgi:RNA polymerase sigma factor (sigma-70 family)